MTAANISPDTVIIARETRSGVPSPAWWLKITKQVMTAVESKVWRTNVAYRTFRALVPFVLRSKSHLLF
jgi:hypothetical protein